MLPNSTDKPTADRRVVWWLTVSVCLGAMVAANLSFHRWPNWSVLIGVSTIAALAGLSRWAGLGAADLGLARATWMSGLRWGGVCVGIAALAYATALLIPAARGAVSGAVGS